MNSPVNTYTNLLSFAKILKFFFVISIIATVICFIAMVSGEGAMPFFIFLMGSITIFINATLMRAVADIYNATVNKTN